LQSCERLYEVEVAKSPNPTAAKLFWKLSLHSIHRRQYLPLDFMDSVISLLNGDLSIWGVLAMPTGVVLCFGPALLVWLKQELGASEKDKDRK